MCALIREYGGFDALLGWIHRIFRGKRGGQLGMGLLVGAMDIATANNTVAIVMANPIAKEMAQEYGITPRKAASILDTFSCIFQGIIPYGAQMLVAISAVNELGGELSAFQIMPRLFYPMLLLVSSVIAILWNRKENKKFCYQLSKATVEIERMVIRVENLFIESSSLEPTLLERIRMNLEKIPQMQNEEPEKIYSWWNDLGSDFIRLNQNYQDYMRELNSVKAEEMMKTKEFLVFKDRLIEYLRSFVKSLQVNVTAIEQQLRSVDREVVNQILQKVTEYELSIPRMDTEIDEQMIYDKMKGRWESISEWFSGKDGMESEAGKVFDTTNEIIRKITRYATRISEMSNQGSNRREEYKKLADIFGKCRDINEAHRLSAVVFGIEKPLHLKGELSRETDSINSGVYEEEAYAVTVTPRVRTYKQKARRSGIVDRSKEKEEMRLLMIRRLEEERKLLGSYIHNGRLEFASLPVIEPSVRDMFLLWLSKALERKNHCAKTEDGQMYYIEQADVKEYCMLKCTDGTFQMPAYTIVFEDGESK